jgi:hypothetical protein
MPEQKMAAFHSMLHRACILPLLIENFDKEVAYIKETAGLNGYIKTTIGGLMSKHLFKRKIKEVTTLSPISKEVTTKPYVLHGYFKEDFQHQGKARYPNGS